MPCLHCRRDVDLSRRDLCHTCYKDDAVRSLYPKFRASDYEPTEEEQKIDHTTSVLPPIEKDRSIADIEYLSLSQTNHWLFLRPS